MNWNNFQQSFIETFIEDDRYKYIVQGLQNTLLIAFFALLIGVVIGIICSIIKVSSMQYKFLKPAEFFVNIYLTIARGTPVVVQLLIIYLVIFGSVNINPIYIAIIAFGLNSGAYVTEIIRSGILAVDKGQMEAGRSIGLNYIQTMTKIIMPQAIKNILPALLNESIALLKETAIAGYIAIPDLTKGGDIIQSETYKPFMPLFSVALIYLVIVGIMTFLMGRLERRLRKSDVR